MSSKELRKSFTPSYFSIEDILASQSRIPCQTEVNITKFGFLDPSQESEDLPAGTDIELPLWAARVMCKQKRAFINIKMPKYFNDKYREVLKADPTVVDLNKMGPQFYQAGLQLCTLPNDESEQISDLLPEVLQKRLGAIADVYSLNREVKSTGDATSNEMGGILRVSQLDPLEEQLYSDGKRAAEDLEKWLKS